MILRCTKKLLAEIGPRQLTERPADGEDWYANLLRLDGRKCRLLTHAATLFTVFEADLRAAELRDSGNLATGLIRREPLREGLPANTFGDMVPASVIVAKTADRSILGCMNDMGFMCETVTDRSGGRLATDIAGLNQTLRRNINSARDYQQPIELAAQRLRQARRVSGDRGSPQPCSLRPLASLHAETHEHHRPVAHHRDEQLGS